MGQLTQLMGVKKMRERRAERALAEQHRVHAVAHAQRDEAERELQECRRAGQVRERAMYTDLCSRVVVLADIEDVQLSMVEIRHAELQKNEQFSQREMTRQQELAALESRRIDRTMAWRTVNKFEELDRQQKADAAIEQERSEDNELEHVGIRPAASPGTELPQER